RSLVPLLHPLPELALVHTGIGGAVLLALMLEDRADLEPELLLGHRHQEVRLGDRPLLPGAAVEPLLGRPPVVARERARYCLVAHAVRAVRIGEIAGDEEEVRPLR